jgi:hypothetical protein
VYTGSGIDGMDLITFSHPKPESVRIVLHGKQTTLF